MSKLIHKNKIAYSNYKIEREIEAGISLFGHEVKSIKNGQINLRGAHVSIHNGEAFLANAHVSPYKYASNLGSYDPSRRRKLLLRREELNQIIDRYKTQGMAIVPLSVFNNNGLIKLKLGVGRGMKKHDKREGLKKQEIEKRLKRATQNRY